jgi:Zn-dependent protease with chaperone function
MNDSSATVLPAQWFDGRTARARPARVRLLPGADGPRLQLQALDGEREALDLTHRQVGWPERWSARRPPPRVVIDLGAQGSLQLDDVPGWQAALAAAGGRATLVEHMQTRWGVLLGVLLLAAVGVAAFYRWGTPWAAAQITRHVPLSWEQQLGERALAQIDDGYTKPSRLPAARQAELRAAFERLASRVGSPQAAALRRYPGYQPRLALQFRAGMGPNAFALPGGTIVLTDDMVEQARTLPATGEPALLGVLAHEIGHVQLRHTTRMVVEQGVLQVGLGLALGDVSSLVSSGASLLTGLAYSRSHEREADCYAVALMRQASLPTAPMADLLLGIDRPAAKDPPRSSDSDWFSTHPDTAARALRLKAGGDGDCAPTLR